MEKFVLGKPEEYIQWYDTAGNIINASDGGVIYVDGKYYWYGMKMRQGGQGYGEMTTTGVVMYSSADLHNWEYEGVILECSDDPASDLYGPLRFERTKIIYNKKTKKFVLWTHFVKNPGVHGRAIGTAEAGIASCDTVNGKYTWHGYTRPVDERGAVKDSTLFVDDDGKGYFIYDRVLGQSGAPDEDRCIHIVELTEDYLQPTDHYLRVEAAYWREAPCVFKHEGWYYMLTSSISGWHANKGKYCRARNIMGPWEDMGDPWVGDTDGTSFHSQGTYVFKAGDQWIYMSERHNIEDFEKCSAIWLPIEFTGDGTLQLIYKEEW